MKTQYKDIFLASLCGNNLILMYSIPVSKVIKDCNQITNQQVIRLQSWGYVLITITDFDSITIILQSMITN